jgi:hypothetical protein
LQEYRTRWPAGLEFPPEDYIAEFAIFLPHQHRLARIDILFLADTYPNCQDFFGVVDMRELLELSAEYVFSARQAATRLLF